MWALIWQAGLDQVRRKAAKERGEGVGSWPFSGYPGSTNFIKMQG